MIEDEVEGEAVAQAEAAKTSVWKSWRFWMPRAAFEAALIVLSLLLALWLSDWQEQRRIDRDVAETRQALVAEIRANREMLLSDPYIPHHHRLSQVLMRTVNTARTGDELRQGGYELYRGGIHLPPLRDAAWRTASASGLLQHMDRQEVFALTDVYGAQDSLVRSVTAYYPSLLNMAAVAQQPEALRGAMFGVVMFMGDLNGGEADIVRLQGEALAAMGQPDPEPVSAPPAPDL